MKISVPKEKLEGFPDVPAGKYTFRFDGFYPKKSKNAQNPSVNLGARLAIINHPTLTDSIVFHNANVGFPPGLYDLAHALGVKYEGEDTSPNPDFPGEFICKVHGPSCDSSDPENWIYQGPISGQVGELEVAEADNGKGGKTTKLSRFFCKVPGCTARHKDSLL